MKDTLISVRNRALRTVYKWILKPILFQFDAELIHDSFIKIGQTIGKSVITRKISSFFCNYKESSLEQNIASLNFVNPLGLAAGFDYEGRLTETMPEIGFGFETIGTITNYPYGGNIKPRLGRLPKSRSLLVNKGFKNLGIHKTLENLVGKKFKIPVGLSIGVTNTSSLSNQKEAILDIVNAFKVAENYKIPFSYYELNISCPNLQTSVEFYSATNLEELLSAVTKNKLSKPLFIKMPIDKTDTEVLEMLEVILKYGVTGVIFGNLQKNKQDPTLDPKEVALFSKGNFSGKPTEKRSNELISLTYKTCGGKIIIIGCGGVFNADDAYKKIKLGASLVQLITGMIFEGPQVISDINLGLVKLLKKDSYKNISEAIGKD
ncbi:MAG: quinone-dependent dihydroorotate dehydrogenase [Candidatus Pacebacteria bacterium]|nr:quinone-dependent dihydroorotate dehydrogenase [Candidatus Paceibacterota bacterium]